MRNMKSQMSNSHYRIESRHRALELSDPSVRPSVRLAVGQASASLLPQAREARRVLFVAYQFAPSLEMGARSCAQVARYLPLHGWSPIVLTAHEKYIEERYLGSADEIAELGLPDAVVKTRLLPHPFDLYRWLKSTFRRRTQDAGAAGT